jgi:A/G-specific adenine glycosylase
MTDADRTLREALLAWYSRNRRDLPWRRSSDPYAIWLSEVMLQQTRVETVIPYYEQFLKHYPDVGSLARASEEDVLALWSGLGYYRRALNLRSAARMLVREHAAKIPEDRDSLKALPGIGGYTAAAISSIAFGRPEAAVDGNVIRVLARIAGLRGRRDSAALRREVTSRAEVLARGPRAGDWTQALMELGAVICLPRDPLCGRCPVSRRCAARRSGEPDRFPEASVVKAPRAERRILLYATSGDRFLLVPDEADSGATWTLPYAGGASSKRVARALAARLFGAAAAPEGPHASFRHRTFSHDLTYEVWSLELGKSFAPSLDRTRWATPGELRGLPMRAPTLKAIRNLAR